MDTDLSYQDITAAIEELYTSIGIKQFNGTSELVYCVKNKNIERAIEIIAAQLSLPIKVNIEYVSDEYSLNQKTRFFSTGMTKVDKTGRGIDSITAQVIIPSNLPLYGTKDLCNYPIKVLLSKNVTKRAHTFITLIAHELSHILLHSLRHPKKDDEFYTDLCPLLLGFSEIIQMGRYHEETNDLETTTGITYGYLSDSHFNHACMVIQKKIEISLELFSHYKTKCTKLKQLISDFQKLIQEFDLQLSKLDQLSKSKFKKKDILRLVEFHSFEYKLNKESSNTKFTEYLSEVQSILDRNNLNNLKLIEKNENRLTKFCEEVALSNKLLINDTKFLKRNTNSLLRFLPSI